MKKWFVIVVMVMMFFSPVNIMAKEVSYSEKPVNKIEEKYEVPILGKVKAKEVSLPLLAVVLGLVDGFNPCAMWILVFLISMLFGMKDRKKMWILGGTFILTSGLVYMLFMVSWLNLAVFLTSVKLIRLLIAIFSIVFGMYNIYRYVDGLDKEDGCDVTDKEDRKKIMKRIKKITGNQKFILSIIGIMALAASVNILELLCSLGLPVIFTNVLAINHLNVFEYTLYIFIYLIFFLIDDIVVFVVAMMSMKIKGISSKYTKYSHLVGGILMVILGILMALKPEWLMFNF